jgi:hypothetical protein
MSDSLKSADTHGAPANGGDICISDFASRVRHDDWACVEKQKQQ